MSLPISAQEPALTATSTRVRPDVLTTILAMIGLRVDRSWSQALAMVLGIICCIALSFALTDLTVGNILGTSSHKPLVIPSLVYLAATWTAYYIGHGLFYKFKLNRALRSWLGDERALIVYTTGLGLVYFNVIWCQVPFLAAFRDTIEYPGTDAQILFGSVMLFLTSFSIKAWATTHLGLDGYYYEDMFLEARRDGGPMTQGPYKLFSDPMYSVGYFPIYSGAIYAESIEGLAVAILFHISIYVFNLIVERPFVQRTYGAG